MHGYYFIYFIIKYMRHIAVYFIIMFILNITYITLIVFMWACVCVYAFGYVYECTWLADRNIRARLAIVINLSEPPDVGPGNRTLVL